MDDIYNYLDNRILLAYEYFYERGNKCYNIKQININDTKDINNLKMVLDENKINFFINQIFNTSIKYIKKNNIKYIFKRNGVYDTNIELSLYNDDDIKNDNNNKNEMMKFLLSEFITYDQTKHIIIPILNLDIKLKHLQLFLNKFNINDDINKLNNENPEKYIKINITEHFYSQTYLNDILNKMKDITENDLKILLFQLIHTLAIIRTKYNGFVHNNLTLNNIPVYITEKNKSKRSYTFKNNTYEINSIGFDIKLDNFENSDLDTNDTNDLIIFIESLNKNNNVINLINKNKNISNLISNIINIKDPIKIMSSNYFDDLLRTNKKKKSNDTKKTKRSVVSDSSEMSDSDVNVNNNNMVYGKRNVEIVKEKKKHQKTSTKKYNKHVDRNYNDKSNNVNNDNSNVNNNVNSKTNPFSSNDYKKVLNLSNEEYNGLKMTNDYVGVNQYNNMSISPDFNLLNNQIDI